MDVAPAAAEVAVEAEAVVEVACVQQYAAAAAWVRQQAACERQQAAEAGGMIAMDGMQPECMRQWAADAACMQQHVVAAACVRQRAGAAGSTIAMGCSDGSGQPAAQLRWAVAAAVAQRTAGRRKNCDEQRLRQWATVG